jgi:hypothetical protein
MARWRRDARDSARELPSSGTVIILGYYDGSARVLDCGVAVQ